MVDARVPFEDLLTQPILEWAGHIGRSRCDAVGSLQLFTAKYCPQHQVRQGGKNRSVPTLGRERLR